MTRDPPQAHHLLPGDLPPPTIDEGVPLAPRPGPAPALTGRGQLLAPLLIGPVSRREWGMQPGIVPQPGQELDAGRTVLGRDQRPDDARQREAAVESGQVL